MFESFMAIAWPISKWIEDDNTKLHIHNRDVWLESFQGYRSVEAKIRWYGGKLNFLL